MGELTPVELVVLSCLRDRCCAPECWRARCRLCREWITKHDFTRQEALELAVGAEHRCG